jgi:ligand-binding sensor domain-containing protein
LPPLLGVRRLESDHPAAESARRPSFSSNALSCEEKPRVASVILDANGNLVAATSTAGVFISSDQGRTWRPANRGLATRRIRRMVLGPDGEFYIATDAVIGGPIRIYQRRRVAK